MGKTRSVRMRYNDISYNGGIWRAYHLPEPRAMTSEDRSFGAFWASLVPRSNRRTGFSVRRATKRPFVAFDLVGFRFSYRIDDNTPNAQVAFHIVRSDGDEIYDYLLQRRAEVEAAFGG